MQSRRADVDSAGRRQLSVVEHGEAELPAEIVRPDGSLDLYEDIQSRVTVEYKRRRRRLVVRAGGWIGYLPLNGKYALRVDTRVRVANLEKVVARSASTRLEVFDRYLRSYSGSRDLARSLYDVVTEQFLATLALVWRDGLAKVYRRQEHESISPIGRIDAYRTAVSTNKTGQPRAVSRVFSRTVDSGPNRVIKAALKRLIATYSTIERGNHQAGRRRRLREAMAHVQQVGVASQGDLVRFSAEAYIRKLPAHRLAYANALRLAQLINGGLGVALRSSGGRVELPVMLVDMSHVFECYARETLRRWIPESSEYEVLDGNLAGDRGARVDLFNRFDIDGQSPPATPDLVVRRENRVRVVIDVKYKPARQVPERAEINQVVCYGARYACNKVIVVYPETPADGSEFCSIGMIGAIRVYRASLDLNAIDLDAEESRFAEAVFGEA